MGVPVAGLRKDDLPACPHCNGSLDVGVGGSWCGWCKIVYARPNLLAPDGTDVCRNCARSYSDGQNDERARIAEFVRHNRGAHDSAGDLQYRILTYLEGE